jgi:1-phosphatidylinositol phosphodiesterase
MATLTIRNLTDSPIELKIAERYEDPKSPEPTSSMAAVSNMTSNFTNLLSSKPSSPPQPSHAELAQNASTHSTIDISVPIKPFTIVETPVKVQENSPTEILRLTFEADGERYRIDVPSSTPGSTTFSALTPNPKKSYTGIYNRDAGFLAIFSSANLNSWMKELKDNVPISALSIPGTHNSPTCHRALPSVRCQAVSIKDQLENGVRFFDIRVQPDMPEDPSVDGLILVHGVFPISLTGNKYFRDVVNEVEGFLQRNPSETLIMSVKREGPGSATDAQLSKILRNHYAGDVHKWFTAPRVPSLGEARGKIVLLRRFALDESLKAEWEGAGWCINAESWAYNTPNDLHGEVCVQDFCEVLETENIDKKIGFCEEHLERAAYISCNIGPVEAMAAHDAAEKTPLYLNFLSASNFWKVGCWPDKIAAKLNPAMADFLCRQHHVKDEAKGDGGTGVVVCDWVGNNGDWDLVRCIVGWNAKLKMRGEGR